MTIQIGAPLPQATFLVMQENQPVETTTAQLFGSGRHVIFAMPGAYTATCSALHIPNVVAHADALRERGIDSISVLTVNDPFALDAWGRDTGADKAGIAMIADPAADFSAAIGLTFSVPARGLLNRSQRYSMLVEDGVVRHLNIEPPCLLYTSPSPRDA